jgi:hypothetical protein
MNEEDIAELRRLVRDGAYCGDGYNLNSIIYKIPLSRDRYIDGGFDWDIVLHSKVPILVFCNACNDVVRYKCDPLPTNKQHILSELQLSSKSNMVDFIESRAQSMISEGGSDPPDQCNIEFNAYVSKFRSAVGKRYVSNHEILFQAGACETPIHVECGRLVAYIPPCFQTLSRYGHFSQH